MSKLTGYLLVAAISAAILAGCVRPRASARQSGYLDAMELKLKGRELADQMLATVPNDALKGFVAMPVSFVNEANGSAAAPLGKILAESMLYEFNQRGFPTREYQLAGQIGSSGGKNDIARAAGQVSGQGRQPWAALLLGSYYVDKDAVFINARLVRALDGLVLRTGQIVMPHTSIAARMGGAGAANGAPAPSLPSGSIPIVQGR